MSADHFVMISQWRLPASVDDVWCLIRDVEAWPRWWPALREARLLRHGSADGSGAVAELRWASRLGYVIRLRLTTGHVDSPRQIEAHAEGDLRGHALWVLQPDGARGVTVTHRWDVSLNRPWMRLLAPVLRPVFAWNHFVLMRQCATGMADHLGCVVDEWHESASASRLHPLPRSA